MDESIHRRRRWRAFIRPGVAASQGVEEIASTPAVTCTADETLEEAVTRMAHREIGHLPVVAADDPRRLVGYLSRSDVLKARRRRGREERFSSEA
jgi:CIC family chloride channel protein